MESNLNKLQIRAKVLSILSELKTDTTITHAKFKEHVESLSEIQDKDDLFDILSKELNKVKEPYITAVKTILVETIPSDILKDKILNILTSRKLPDQAKYQLIQVLKDMGGKVDYENFLNYFENPESIIDYDTEKLLEFALVNPETQIDFLDFLTSIADGDKLILINSLNEEYQGENLANILTPILYSEMNEDVIKRVIEILAETKSSLAIEPITYFMGQTEDESLVSFCKKNLNILKLAGATEQKADIFYKMTLSNSKIYKCYTTIPDGHDNQGIIVTRKRNDETYQIYAVVVSGLAGIVDCFGFNSIGIAEIDRIIARFYQSETKIEITPEYCKTIINKAINLNKIFKEKFPYEFICWNNALRDISEYDCSVEDIIKQEIKPIELNKNSLKELYKKNYLDKWFFSADDDKNLREIIDNSLKQNVIDIKQIETDINESFEKIWNDSATYQLEQRIINTAYLIMETGKIKEAQVLYSILSSPKFKNELMLSIIRKSIYEHFLLMRENIKESQTTTNIFRLRQHKESTADIKKINDLIKNIEKNWAD